MAIRKIDFHFAVDRVFRGKLLSNVQLNHQVFAMTIPPLFRMSSSCRIDWVAFACANTLPIDPLRSATHLSIRFVCPALTHMHAHTYPTNTNCMHTCHITLYYVRGARVLYRRRCDSDCILNADRTSFPPHSRQTPTHPHASPAHVYNWVHWANRVSVYSRTNGGAASAQANHEPLHTINTHTQ